MEREVRGHQKKMQKGKGGRQEVCGRSKDRVKDIEKGEIEMKKKEEGEIGGKVLGRERGRGG